LLPGDIGNGIEEPLVQGLGPRLKSDVLVAGHHGSATSTGASFLDAVAPGLVLYATGYANRFGFPSREVRERVAVQGTRTLDTGISGAIELRFGTDGTIRGPWTWRGRVGRLWTHLPEEKAADR
jgi:competence protein ComEC